MSEVTEKILKALKDARHELVTLDGLMAADGVAPSYTWEIDTKVVVATIDDALKEFPCTEIQLS